MRSSDPYKVLPKAKKYLGIRFKNAHFAASALIHPSYRNECPIPGLEDFDRLEFFGDSLLNFVVCRKIYKEFPEADEGLLSRLRSIIVSRRILARIANKFSLPRVISISKSLKEQFQFSKSKIFADTFEAILGALYFDQGFAKAEAFILKHFEGYFDAKKLFRLDPNPKSTLQELTQKRWQKIPCYANEPKNGQIRTTVSVDRRRKAVAWARTRKESEEKAARLLLRKIRQEFLRGSKKRSSAKKVRKTL